MQFREIAITLDTTASVGFHPFEVVDGDTGNVLNVTLTNGGEPILLNECTLCIVYSSSIGFAMQDQTSGITLGETAGNFSVLLNPENYGPGNVSADIQVYSGPNRRVLITSKTFDFRCRSTLVSEAIIRANQAYPPLIAAAREAVEAAEAARLAAGDLNLARGEMNVQADWASVDTASDAYILHKPYIPAEPEDVGAAAAVHGARHASAGADPVTPAAIGAARTSTTRTATLYASAWTGTEAPYTYALAVAGVTATDAVEVLPGLNITAVKLQIMQEANLQDGGQAAGSITLKAYGEKPVQDLPVRVIVRGDL